MRSQLLGKAGIAFLLAIACACGGSKFSSSQGPARGPEQVPAGANGGSNPASLPGGSPTGGGTAGGPTNIPPGAGGGLVTAQQSDCLLKKADKYNITLVFDNSGSTNTSDPSNVRQQGALQFAKKFVEFVSLNPTAEVKMSTVRFASSASRGAHGWVKLGVSTEQDVVADIIASTSNSASGTAYTPAMKEAQSLMTEIGASVSEKRQRNYVVFLSDGRPNGSGESKTNVAALFDPVVNTNGAAVLSIAAGSNLKSGDETVMQSLAKPQTGLVSPKHVGQYIKAATPADLQTAYTKLFDVISQCE